MAADREGDRGIAVRGAARGRGGALGPSIGGVVLFLQLPRQVSVMCDNRYYVPVFLIARVSMLQKSKHRGENYVASTVRIMISGVIVWTVFVAGFAVIG